MLRRQTSRGQSRPRQITAAEPQIGRQIPQNINQLQALAKANSLGEQPIVIQLRVWEKMGATDSSPKLSYAARYSVGIILQLLLRLQSNDMSSRTAGESAQIQFLPADDDAERFLD